jgi:phenylacetate-CoA ligase
MSPNGVWPHEGLNSASLAAKLRAWIGRVPLYRKLTTLDRVNDHQFWQEFAQLPVITKRDIKTDFPRNFLTDDLRLDHLLADDEIELEQTSGTSEEPIPLLLAKGWWNKQERAALALNPVVNALFRETPDPRRVTLTSPSCNHDISYRGIPCHSERIVGRSLSINLTRHPFLWPETALARMVEETREWQPDFLDVDPVYGVCFARYCQRVGARFPSLRFIISSYEYCSECHRQLLREVFKVPVYDLYGSTETGHVFMENDRGEMLLSQETAFVELSHVDSQGIGHLLITTLDNEFMPLIRYDIEDLVRVVRKRDLTCWELHGRALDAIRLPSGRRLTVRQLDQAAIRNSTLAHYQLRQVAPDHYRFLMVPVTPGGTEASLSDLRQNLRVLLEEPADLELVSTDYIPGEASGKFRLARPLA